jgi:hypothetical protein
MRGMDEGQPFSSLSIYVSVAAGPHRSRMFFGHTYSK